MASDLCSEHGRSYFSPDSRPVQGPVQDKCRRMFTSQQAQVLSREDASRSQEKQLLVAVVEDWWWCGAGRGGEF